MEKVLTAEEFKNLINTSKKPVLVDFFASWCGPCKMLAPIIEDIENEFSESLEVLKIDIDKCSELAREYNIMSVPTLMIFSEGEVKTQETGFMPKEALINMINSSVNVSLIK